MDHQVHEYCFANNIDVAGSRKRMQRKLFTFLLYDAIAKTSHFPFFDLSFF